jgi:methyl-branched lipid omega-hydroxylase
MRPREELSLDEIRLSDPDVWRQPEEVIEGAFATLRRDRPVSFHEEIGHEPFIEKGRGFWAVTRYEDIARVSRDHDNFRTSDGIVVWDWPPELAAAFSHMGNEDEPRHTRLRRIVSRAFTPKVLSRLDEVIAEEAKATVDRIIDTGKVEFVSEVGGRLPVRIICEMIGIPESYHQFVYEKSSVAIRVADAAFLLGSASVEDTFGAIATSGFELTCLVQELAKERIASPSDDLLSTLMNADIDGEALSETELVQFFILLTVAGNETTRNALSWGMHALSTYPDQKQKWIADVDAYLDTGANEIIRWATPIMYFRRTARADAVVGDQLIRAGEKVAMFYRSGNRDERVFERPYEFDIARDGRPPHMSFGGGGIHYCLGAHLARREVSAMFREILNRIPDIEVVGEPLRPPGNLAHGIDQMDCVFTAGGAKGNQFR